MADKEKERKTKELTDEEIFESMLEEDIIIHVPPVEEYTVTLKILSVKEGKLKMVWDEEDIEEDIVVDPPPKKVVASKKVALSTKDFRKRKPKPVIPEEK